MLDFNGAYFRPAFITGVAIKVKNAMTRSKETPVQATVYKYSKEVKAPAALARLETHLAREGTTFVCGNEPSIADF